jgi:repressor of nif and glnA expression
MYRHANREDAARQHPLRAAILALLAKDGRAMSAAQIRAELAHDPALAAVAYHLKVLGEIDLVCSTDGYYELP